MRCCRFASPFIHDIIAAYQRNFHSAKATVSYLRRTFPRLPTESEGRYDHLAPTTVRSWFDADHKLLPSHQQSIDAGRSLARGDGRQRVLDGHADVEAEVKRVLTIMRTDAGAVINLHIIRWVMRAVMQQIKPTLLDELKLGNSFLSRWAHEQMDWTWRARTGTASKLPIDWREQGVNMAKRIGVNMQQYQVSLTVTYNSRSQSQLRK